MTTIDSYLNPTYLTTYILRPLMTWSTLSIRRQTGRPELQALLFKSPVWRRNGKTRNGLPKLFKRTSHFASLTRILKKKTEAQKDHGEIKASPSSSDNQPVHSLIRHLAQRERREKGRKQKASVLGHWACCVASVDVRFKPGRLRSPSDKQVLQ